MDSTDNKHLLNTIIDIFNGIKACESLYFLLSRIKTRSSKVDADSTILVFILEIKNLFNFVLISSLVLYIN